MVNDPSSDHDVSVSDPATYFARLANETDASDSESGATPGSGEGNREEGSASGNRRKLSLQERWQIARAKFEEDAIIETQATGYNKGGLLVSWLDLPGFVPASQLLGLRRLHLQEERLRHLQQRQNAKLRLKIIELEQDTNRLIFSERATQVAAPQREQLLEQIEPGERRTGVVTNLADFGAFVDLGGVEGLIHLSQLSWRRLKHPSDVVRPGETVEVLVLSVDRAKERIGLSRKQLFQDPWQNVEERYHPDQIVTGIVSSVAPFGAFVLLEPELEALLHVSEFAKGMEADPEAVFSKGDEVTARIVQVSEEERRLGLSLRDISRQ
jgi:small subunit ribosomal protein S1